MFLAHFWLAMVSLVSTVARLGLAKVTSVSYGSDSVLSVVGWVLALVGSMFSGAKKFALRAQNGPNSAFLCLLGGYFRANQLHLGLVADATHLRLATAGVLRHAKRCVGVSPACRTLAWRNSPRLAAARPGFARVRPPKRRPIG